MADCHTREPVVLFDLLMESSVDEEESLLTCGGLHLLQGRNPFFTALSTVVSILLVLKELQFPE